MLNVVRSAVVTSSRRTNCVASPDSLDRISRRLTSNDVINNEPRTQDRDSNDHQRPTVAKIDRSRVPVVNENELDERFISGWGPGGQSVNKAVNCCQLRHRPTGIVVKVHQSRSLEQNRKIARELIARRLDNLYNGDQSVDNQSKRLALQKISKRESESQKRRMMKEQFKKITTTEVSD